MDEASQDKTAFITHEGKFVFNRMPMGLSGSPATFQSCADAFFSGVSYKYLQEYLDHLLIYSSTWEDHMSHLK